MNLREYITVKKISKNRAARELEVSRQYLHGVLTGLHPPSLKLTKKIVNWSKGEITPSELRPDWGELFYKTQMKETLNDKPI